MQRVAYRKKTNHTKTYVSLLKSFNLLVGMRIIKKCLNCCNITLEENARNRTKKPMKIQIQESIYYVVDDLSIHKIIKSNTEEI